MFANKFAEFLTGSNASKDATTGNIVSLGFLILNAVGAVISNGSISDCKTYWTS